MLNVHAVAATCAAVAGVALLGDKSMWWVFLLAAVAIEGAWAAR
jgi:hypothetical protein